jgi:serine/threonine-protein kinase
MVDGIKEPRVWGKQLPIDPSILTAAAAALTVTNLAALITGGQKFVGTADGPGSETRIVKIIEFVPPYAAIALERARREVHVLASINHPNVVKVVGGLVELGNPPSAVCWLEERLDGDDLRAHLGAPQPWATVRSMASDAFAGLAAFHADEVVHRDLSPNNIRCLSNGSHVVMDPGIARFLAETTITGTYDPGTPGYMSPEHVSPAASPTYASDVFGIGVLMYQYLTGSLPIPFSGDRVDYARRLRDEQGPSVGLIRTDLTPDEIAFVDRCLNRQLARRYLDAQEALDALAVL